MGPFPESRTKASLKCLLFVVAAVASSSGHASAGSLVHMRKTVWGCVDPNAAPTMNEYLASTRADPAAIERTRVEGQCVTISSKSLWEALSADHDGITYVAYRGTAGKPGSYWVPTSALVPAPVEAAVPPPAPSTPLEVQPPAAMEPPRQTTYPPVGPPSSSKHPAAAVPQALPAPDTGDRPKPDTTQPSPPSTAPSQQGGSGGGLWGLAFLAVAGWVVSRLFKRGKRPRSVSRTAPPPRPVPATAARPAPRTVSVPAARPPPPAVSGSVSPRTPVVPAGSPALAWHPPGSRVTVVGLTVMDGMIYVGRSRADAHDSSFIDTALPVAPTSLAAGPLGYWPSYKLITPPCRRRYIEWLASGKQAPDTDIGYVFLYFYGLERRLLLDRPPPEEQAALVAEIRRLRTIYSSSGSFDGHSQRLIEAVAVLRTAADPSPFAPDLERAPGYMPPGLKLAIAREVVAGRPLGFELCAAGLLGNRDFSSMHPRVLDHARQPLLAVLRSRFAAAFPEGFQLRNRKDSHLRLTYDGASSGLHVDLAAQANLKDLPDPETLTWTRLVTFGNTVALSLAPYAKALAFYPARANALCALADCPPELRGVLAPEARRWLEALPPESAVPFGELANHAIGTGTAKWTVRHRRLVGEALAAMGCSMVPDAEDDTAHLEDSTTVHVIKYPAVPRTRALDVAYAAAMLVSAMAKSAEQGADRVRKAWLEKVPSRMALTAEQTAWLKAQLAWLSTRPATLARAKRVLGEASEEEREFCAWSATTAAAATMKIEKPQVQLLEGIYKSLDVPRGKLYTELHSGIAASVTPADEPVSVSEWIAEPMHAIPPPPRDPAARSADADRLDRIRRETAQVSAMLGEVFAEDEVLPRGPEEQTGDGPLAGLDARHAELVTKLLAREEWSRADFDAAAAGLDLMPGGAMETVNEWAYDHLGDALLDDGETVTVNRGLIQADAVAQ